MLLEQFLYYSFLILFIQGCALAAGAFGFTWGVLTDGGNIFDFVPKVYYKVFGKKRPKLEKLVFSCSKCSAGQAALWGGFLAFHYCDAIQYAWYIHLMIIILAITTAAKLNK